MSQPKEQIVFGEFYYQTFKSCIDFVNLGLTSFWLYCIITVGVFGGLSALLGLIDYRIGSPTGMNFPLAATMVICSLAWPLIAYFLPIIIIIGGSLLIFSIIYKIFYRFGNYLAQVFK